MRKVVFEYNSFGRKDMKGLSPYEIVFTMRCPRPLLFNVIPSTEFVPQETNVKLVDRVLLAKEMVRFLRKDVERRRRKRARFYSPYNVGDRVYVRNFASRTDKSAMKWEGPYTVSEIGLNACQLEGRQAAVSWHDLKRCFKRKKVAQLQAGEEAEGTEAVQSDH